ncbi:MAG: RecX family transcriptional regulator [Bacteroidia bacterium]|jgi:regulatory protein|nr:RecX family transcriptional regulator [Bacteroidia bacterium]
MKSSSLTPKQALLKAAAYCAYQERCYQEVEAKLAEWGITGVDAGNLLITLSEQNYLNEERFAKAFAGGKFRVKQWGKIKIMRELKLRNVSDYCIKQGLLQIDDGHYLETIHQLAQSKLDSLKETNIFARKQKAAQYLIAKGYEANLVWNVINQLTS